MYSVLESNDNLLAQRRSLPCIYSQLLTLHVYTLSYWKLDTMYYVCDFPHPILVCLLFLLRGWLHLQDNQCVVKEEVTEVENFVT